MSSKQEIWELEEAICKAMADNARYRTKLGEQALKYAELRRELATAKELIAVMEDRLNAFELEEMAMRDTLRNSAKQARAVVSAAFRAEERRLEEKSALHGHPVEDRREVGMPFIRASADMASARLLAEAALDRWASAGCPSHHLPQACEEQP